MMEYRVKRRPKSTKKKVANARRNRRQGGDVFGGSSMNAPEWDQRFFVTTSKDNGRLHSFFREYFDKKPKEISSSFRIKYANSTNELPGITDVKSRIHSKVKEFKSVPEQPH